MAHVTEELNFNLISMNLNNHMWLLTTELDSRALDDNLLGKNFQEQFLLFLVIVPPGTTPHTTCIY